MANREKERSKLLAVFKCEFCELCLKIFRDYTWVLLTADFYPFVNLTCCDFVILLSPQMFIGVLNLIPERSLHSSKTAEVHECLPGDLQRRWGQDQGCLQQVGPLGNNLPPPFRAAS